MFLTFCQQKKIYSIEIVMSIALLDCLNPKLSSHGIYIPNGCKHFKAFLQLFHGSEANSNKPLKIEKISGLERLVLPFPKD